MDIVFPLDHHFNNSPKRQLDRFLLNQELIS